MAVYVDHPTWAWKGRMWCHVTADSFDELHAFAKRLGLKREWFQDGRYPHYDTVFHKKALKLGAVQVTSREIVQAAKRLRGSSRL